MKNIAYACFLACLTIGTADAESPAPTQIDISQTVIKMPIDEGVSMDDAIQSMKLRANAHNMMFVAHQPLSEQLKKMGTESRRLEIFQFCDPVTARKMVDYNAIFAAYMPCRIALVEEPDGQAYLMMLNLDMLIQGAQLPSELRELAVQVNTTLTDIMEAGATGDL